MRIVRFFQPLLLAAAVVTAGAAPVTQLELRLDAPPSITDLQPLVIHVALTNTGRDAITVPEPQYLRNVRVEVTPLQVARTARCTAHITYDGVTGAGVPVRALKPGDAISADGDLTMAWPLGLAPGHYRLTAVYNGVVRSAPVEITVVQPSGSGMYEQMMDVCAALQQHTAGAADRAILFVGLHPEFPWPAALLDYTRQNVRGADRTAVANVLVDRYSSSREAEPARRELAHAERHHAAVLSRQEYDARYAAEMAKLPVRQRVDVSNALATIRDAADFARVEQFLSRNQGTFFGAEALHVMIEAVQRGVLPPGAMSADTAIHDLNERIRREYPDSYWSQRNL